MDENSKNELKSNQISTSKKKINGNNEQEEKGIKIGNYIIKKTLGKGTFAKVKLAIQLPKKNKVAIKIIEKRRLKEEDDIIRLKREFEMLIQFNNPNVISVTEIFESDNAYFTVMEYCEGGELFNYIVENKILSEEKAAFFYYQLINGLEYIHSLNIVHRDLKPENLLLTGDQILKIIDFGLSNYYKKNNNNQLLETPCGSPCYASPEMLSGEGYDGFKIDIWATGIILFAMLCGYLPFDHKDNNILFKKILECKINYPKHLSSDSKDLIKKILVSNPGKRISIPEIKKHPFYLKGKEIFENNFSILQISRDSSNSSLIESEEIYFDSSNSGNNKFLWYEFNHKSQNLFINMPEFSLKNLGYIKTTKSKSFEKNVMTEYNIKKYLNKILKNRKKEKQEFMKQIQKDRLYLNNCFNKNTNCLLTFNYSVRQTVKNIDELCEKIINQYKKEQRSKIKYKFEKNKLLENNFRKINNQKIREINAKIKDRKKQIFLSNDFNIFNDSNGENEKTINKSNNIHKQINTEVLQTQNKNKNLNDLIKQKVTYLNRKQKNKINLNNQNIKVNIRKTTPIKFMINEHLVKHSKLSKINKIPINTKEKIEQNIKTQKVDNPKIQKLKNILNIINQQSNKPNINIINRQKIIHHHVTNITNLTKTNYYSNILINNSKRSQADKKNKFSKNKFHLSNNILNNSKEKKKTKDYLKLINTKSLEDIKKSRLKLNLKEKNVLDNNTNKKINNRHIKIINTNDINSLRIQDIDKHANVTNKDKKISNQLNNIRLKVFQNAKNISKLNRNNIKFNLATNKINNNNKNKFSKSKESISLEYSLRNNLDTTNYDKTYNYFNIYINMNNSLDNPKNDYLRKKNFEKIGKKKLNLNLNHLNKFINNKDNYNLDNNNFFNYTDRNIINNSLSKKLKNAKNNLFKKQNNNIKPPKLKLKELLTLPNQYKKDNSTSINYFNQQNQTQRDKNPKLTIRNSKNNKNINKYIYTCRSKEGILPSSERNNIWNMTSNQIFTNYLNKKNPKFLRNNNHFLNMKKNTNSNFLNKINMTNDNIKFNKDISNLKKILNTIQNRNKIHDNYFKIIDHNDKKNSTIISNNNREIETTRIKRKKINLNPNIINDNTYNLNKTKIAEKFNFLKDQKDFFKNNKILLNNKTNEIKSDNNNRFFNPNTLIKMQKNNEKNQKNINNKTFNIQNIANKSNILNLKYYLLNTEINPNNNNNNEKNNGFNFSQTVRNNKILQLNKINYTKIKK